MFKRFIPILCALIVLIPGCVGPAEIAQQKNAQKVAERFIKRILAKQYFQAHKLLAVPEQKRVSVKSLEQEYSTLYSPRHKSGWVKAGFSGASIYDSSTGTIDLNYVFVETWPAATSTGKKAAYLPGRLVFNMARSGGKWVIAKVYHY